MLKPTLTLQTEDLLKRERQWLADLQLMLSKLGATPDEQATLSHSTRQLDELFLLVVVGEFNAGKSALINALLGQTLLKEGVTPTTAQINVLKYGENSQRMVEEAHLHVLTEPLELLRHLNIVDTPGTNAIIREHQTITEHFVPRADLVLFITSADRPFTESERTFLSQIKAWGKKVVVVVNKIDIFESEAELQQVLDFVRENTLILLGLDNKTLRDWKPEIFPVSGRLALRAKQGQPALWVKSRFEPLEQFVQQTLDQTTRLQLKLLNPLGVSDRFVKQYGDIITNRLTLLADDINTLTNLDNQMNFYQQDMQRDFRFRLADMENVLHDMEKRGKHYFDETLRLGHFFDLLQKQYVQRGFEHQVVANVPQLIEEKVTEMIDWLVNADLKQWQAVTDYLQHRKEQYQNQIVGEVGQNFRYDRDRLIDSVGKSVQRVVESYDKEFEAQKIAEDAQMAVAGTAMAQIGAIGLGATIIALTTTAAMDVTGILAASVVAALGLFVLPHRRETAKTQLENRMAELRIHLTTTLTNQFNKELNRSLQRINEAVAPYTRFVRAEKERLEGLQLELKQLQLTQARLKAEIETLGN